MFEHIFISSSELAYDDFVLQTATTIDLYPSSLNLVSNGKWVTVYVEFPEGYNVDDVNVSSILLNGTVPVDPTAPIEIGDYDSDGIPDLMVKFNRAEIIEYILSKGIKYRNITLTLSGKLYNDTPFQGSDIIKVSALTGDVNCDGVIDISDLVQAAISYGSKEGDPNWNANANFSQSNEVIDILDLVTIAAHYGEKYP